MRGSRDVIETPYTLLTSVVAAISCRIRNGRWPEAAMSLSSVAKVLNIDPKKLDRLRSGEHKFTESVFVSVLPTETHPVEFLPLLWVAHLWTVLLWHLIDSKKFIVTFPDEVYCRFWTLHRQALKAKGCLIGDEDIPWPAYLTERRINPATP